MWSRLQLILAKNWGMPYHFILAFFLVFILAKVCNPAWVCVGVLLLATGYEVWQFKVGQNNSFDFAGDMVANILGIGVGAWLS